MNKYKTERAIKVVGSAIVLTAAAILFSTKGCEAQDFGKARVDSVWKPKKFSTMWKVRVVDSLYQWTMDWNAHCYRCTPILPKDWIVVNDGNKSFLKPIK